MAKSIKILKEDVNPRTIHPRDLTNDCYYIYRVDEQIDLAQASGMVCVFDAYHDLGILLRRIVHAGGRRNPKFQEPQL